MSSSRNSIEKAAELLLKGAVMLHVACPVCSDPIYRFKNSSLYCVTCDRSVIYESDMKTASTDDSISPMGDNNDPIKAKIVQLSKQLKNEVDPEKIVSLAETIRRLQKL